MTFEEYLKLPHTMKRYDIIDGVMVMPPAPSWEHQWVAANLFRLLDAHARRQGIGVVLFAPVDIEVQHDPLRTRQPDLLFLSTERTGITGRAQLRGVQTIQIAPDLTVEILSPNDARGDIQDKLDDYRRIGVRECWLVSPEAETVEVLRLSSETPERIGLFGRGETVRSGMLPDLHLSVDDIFA